MISRPLKQFWEHFSILPSEIRFQAVSAYYKWEKDPYQKGLAFKKVKKSIYSVRINDNYRTLGWKEGNTVFWFWIGTHPEYEKIIYRC